MTKKERREVKRREKKFIDIYYQWLLLNQKGRKQ
jgi:hypothetical protein